MHWFNQPNCISHFSLYAIASLLIAASSVTERPFLTKTGALEWYRSTGINLHVHILRFSSIWICMEEAERYFMSHLCGCWGKTCDVEPFRQKSFDSELVHLYFQNLSHRRSKSKWVFFSLRTMSYTIFQHICKYWYSIFFVEASHLAEQGHRTVTVFHRLLILREPIIHWAQRPSSLLSVQQLNWRKDVVSSWATPCPL